MSHHAAVVAGCELTLEAVGIDLPVQFGLEASESVVAPFARLLEIRVVERETRERAHLVREPVAAVRVSRAEAQAVLPDTAEERHEERVVADRRGYEGVDLAREVERARGRVERAPALRGARPRLHRQRVVGDEGKEKLAPRAREGVVVRDEVQLRERVAAVEVGDVVVPLAVAVVGGVELPFDRALEMPGGPQRVERVVHHEGGLLPEGPDGGRHVRLRVPVAEDGLGAQVLPHVVGEDLPRAREVAGRHARRDVRKRGERRVEAAREELLLGDQGPLRGGVGSAEHDAGDGFRGRSPHRNLKFVARLALDRLLWDDDLERRGTHLAEIFAVHLEREDAVLHALERELEGRDHAPVRTAEVDDVAVDARAGLDRGQEGEAPPLGGGRLGVRGRHGRQQHEQR